MIGEWMTPSPNPLPQGGEGLFLLSPLPVGEGWVRALFLHPAKGVVFGIEGRVGDDCDLVAFTQDHDFELRADLS